MLGRLLSTRKGQSTVEYAVLVAMVVGAVLAMQIFMKRGTMGRMQTATDQIGEQFSPMNYTSTVTTSFDGGRQEISSADGSSSSTITTAEVDSRTAGQEHITATLDSESLFETAGGGESE